MLNRNPYQFRGLGQSSQPHDAESRNRRRRLTSFKFLAETISVTVWLLDLLLFTAITLTFFTRWIMFPEPTRKMFDTDVDQTTYLSCGTIAAATLVELVALIPGQRWDKWEYVAYALWWAVVALAMLGGSVVYWILIRDEEVHLGNLSPTLLYPVTGVLATSAAGSVVVSYTGLSQRLGVGVLIVSYLLLGLGQSRRSFLA